MTARTQRREAELAVIEAARKWNETYCRVRDDSLQATDARINLRVAIDKLDALDLEVPDAARTGDNNPCLTSSQAAEWMSRKGRAKQVAGRVFTQIFLSQYLHGTGLTTEQIENRLAGKHQTVSPRITELRDKAIIKDSGERRKTDSGLDAIVWVLTDHAYAAYYDNLPWSWK